MNIFQNTYNNHNGLYINLIVNFVETFYLVNG